MTRQAGPPINVTLPRTCCAGWFFTHTDDCATPHVPRPCSDCYASPGAEHDPHSCAWNFPEPGGEHGDAISADAARWPGHPWPADFSP